MAIRAINMIIYETGRNPLAGWNGPPLRNFDLMAFRRTANNVVEWPRDEGEWRHSDLKNVAYPFVSKLFDDFVDQGGLK